MFWCWSLGCYLEVQCFGADSSSVAYDNGPAVTGDEEST